MFLKRLDVIGFKSFAERISVDFVKGVTAVVGPNGSGKSNILEYKILQEKGPAHNREFEANVSLKGEVLGVGSGRSKKEAEQHAAQEALAKLQKHHMKQ
ncbi:hypothetical protein DT075_24820 [Bacillus licheniformis]|nr:hypothetical protein DT075_24820 [Bacillus licheniformis]